MKIAILTYAYVPNFGANLQAYSTYSYFLNRGYEPVLLIWLPNSLRAQMEHNTPHAQLDAHLSFVTGSMYCSRICPTIDALNNEIYRLQIDALVVGSDAVLQHHPLLSRIKFPTRRFVSIDRITEDRTFPNPFWGGLHVDKKVLMSVSSQNSEYKYICGKTKSQMKSLLLQYKYISVRDSWTKKMVQYLTDEIVTPRITPDPVFNFNNNVIASAVPAKETIVKKYGLPDKYCLISFRTPKIVNEEYLDTIKAEFSKIGISCVALPMPNGIVFGNNFDYEINMPLSPIDWYALIKYSCGYIGENMHPIIVALHNCVPIYSFDTYGILKLGNLICEKRSSKIFHILDYFQLVDTNFVSAASRYYRRPKASEIVKSIQLFDRCEVKKKLETLVSEYNAMMENIEIALA